jgi:bacterioferritin-associated ferredoxin
MVVFAFYICLCEGVLPEAIPQLLDEAVTGR